jgi:hypothetical protein
MPLYITSMDGPQVSHHPPMSAAHAENEHFTYDITSKVKTKFLGNSLDVFPVGRQVYLSYSDTSICELGVQVHF